MSSFNFKHNSHPPISEQYPPNPLYILTIIIHNFQLFWDPLKIFRPKIIVKNHIKVLRSGVLDVILVKYQ